MDTKGHQPAWYDGFAAIDFAETHGRMPRPGEDFRTPYLAKRQGPPIRPETPLPAWIEKLADERAAELEAVEELMNPRSREAVRRRRREHLG